MAENTEKRQTWSVSKDGLKEFIIQVKASGGIMIRPSKAKLRKQLKHPDKRQRMKAYRWLRYRLDRSMR